jgi:hypothetical protein
MLNIKSYLIHILYRLFLSLQKIKNINLNSEVKIKKITKIIKIIKIKKINKINKNENKLIEIFCLNAEPPILKLFDLILNKNNIIESNIYISIQKWLKLTESTDCLIEQSDQMDQTEQLEQSEESDQTEQSDQSDQTEQLEQSGQSEHSEQSSQSDQSEESDQSVDFNPEGLIEQSEFLIECIDNITKDAINLQFEIDLYIYKFIYSESLLPNLIILMEKICCLLDGYVSCSKYSDIIHDELLPLLQHFDLKYDN